MIQIRPRIFVERTPSCRVVYSMPKGYEYSPPEFIRKAADSIMITDDVDVLQVVLETRIENVLFSDGLNTEIGEEALKEYMDYTGKEWKSPGFFNKRE